MRHEEKACNIYTTRALMVAMAYVQRYDRTRGKIHTTYLASQDFGLCDFLLSDDDYDVR